MKSFLIWEEVERESHLQRRKNNMYYQALTRKNKGRRRHTGEEADQESYVCLSLLKSGKRLQQESCSSLPPGYCKENGCWGLQSWVKLKCFQQKHLNTITLPKASNPGETLVLFDCLMLNVMPFPFIFHH